MPHPYNLVPGAATPPAHPNSPPPEEGGYARKESDRRRIDGVRYRNDPLSIVLCWFVCARVLCVMGLRRAL